MDDQELLQHLLDLENKAAVLVSDAQTEADRRVAEGEKQNHARYDEVYAAEVEALEASFAGDVAVTRDNYRKQLEAYHESLKTMPLNTEAFFSLLEKLLISREP